MPPPKSSRGIPLVVISNVNKGKLDFSETRFVPQDYYDKLTDTRKPESGDVLYTLVGTYGIPVLVDTNRAFCFQRHMALLKSNEEAVLQRYLWYALQQRNFYQSATKIAKGTAQLTVPIKGLRQLTIPMASLPEQQEIVAVLDRLLGREEEVRQSAESVLAAIDSMKQSILARAFHGGAWGVTSRAGCATAERLLATTLLFLFLCLFFVLGELGSLVRQRIAAFYYVI